MNMYSTKYSIAYIWICFKYSNNMGRFSPSTDRDTGGKSTERGGKQKRGQTHNIIFTQKL